MDRNAWNERYRAADLVWGTEPNRFVAEVLADRVPAGRALDLACGEGRNAIWLARRGWQVTAVDLSDVAIERARKLAAAEGVEAEWVCADLTSYVPTQEAFALVVISYLQVPEDARRTVLSHAASALAPEGGLFMIGHARRNLTEGVGGPRDPAVLWEPDEIRAELEGAGFRVERCEEVIRPVDQQGELREAIDVLVEASRPSG